MAKHDVTKTHFLKKILTYVDETLVRDVKLVPNKVLKVSFESISAVIVFELSRKYALGGGDISSPSAVQIKLASHDLPSF